MPQLWLSYDEIAETFGCEPRAAEEAVLAAGWTRKRSHDGLMRALLPQDVMQAYILRTAAELKRRTTRNDGVDLSRIETHRRLAA